MRLEELGLTSKEITAYKKKHIHTVEDLVRWFPRKYRDYTTFTDILDAEDGDYIATKATLERIDIRGAGVNPVVQLTFVSRGRQNLWGDSPRFRISIFAHKACNYLAKIVYPPFLNKNVVVFGKVTFDQEYGYSITPEKNIRNGNGVEYEEEFVPSIYPIYPKIGGVKEENFEALLHYLIPMQNEIVEPHIRKKYGLHTYTAVLKEMHSPRSMETLDKAREQMAFYDLLRFSIGLEEIEKELPKTSDLQFKKVELTKKFMELIPYELTRLEDKTKLIDPETGILSGGQIDALNKMTQKIMSGNRLNAMIEGDVGCGKTLIAFCMMIAAHENGYQSVLMAPKTVLAGQHYEDIKKYADQLGISCAYLRGATTAAEKKERKETLKKIKSGEISLIIGTHSCISKDVEYKKLGLVVLDEEQQFGVDQKLEIFRKALPGCHSIEMSATPIPRSLTMSIYSNKDIIRIIMKPAGRLPIKTDFRSKEIIAYKCVESELKKGRQAYVVCPAIEDNDDVSLVGVETVGENYQKYLTPMGYKVGILNGRMKAEEFNRVVNDFKENKIQVLVSTTVIEVGVNVPNATMIIIHQAERFGLSQLHQLRGRVGRRDYQSYCLMLTDDAKNERVLAMKNLNNGFDIAEADYKMRGPGNIIGTEQSGDSSFINAAVTNPKLFEKAKKCAKEEMQDPLGGFFLKQIYDEHERLEEEYKAGKKKKDKGD